MLKSLLYNDILALHFADNFCKESREADNSFNSDSSGYTSLDEKEAKFRLLSMQSSATAGAALPQPVIKSEPVDEDEGTAV